ncbi:TonB family protein [Nevskia sp.]|uniref:TonB family protein n=1 Tax=Nevskia sp. TaxID=1929292 RepID=UPI0025CB81B6|nr:TonB family protein [Nevskia sp.]
MNASTMSRSIRWESWQLSEEADRRFRKIATIACVPALALILASRFWQEPPTADLAEFDSSQYVELLPEVAAPEPEAAAEEVAEAPKEEPKPVKPIEKPKVQPVEKPPTPTKPVPSARDVAAKTGILALANELNDLRDQNIAPSDQPLNTAAITSKGGIGAATSAAAIAASASAGSGGIGPSSGDVTSTQTGAGVGSRSTGKVRSSLGTGTVAPKGGVPGPDGGRTPSDVQAVFNKNQGPFYAIFNRAARENANIGRGKIVVRLTIAPNGAVTSCTLISSSYGDDAFERKVVERVKLINFGPKNAPAFTMDYPIQFIPQ